MAERAKDFHNVTKSIMQPTEEPSNVTVVSQPESESTCQSERTPIANCQLPIAHCPLPFALDPAPTKHDIT